MKNYHKNHCHSRSPSQVRCAEGLLSSFFLFFSRCAPVSLVTRGTEKPIDVGCLFFGIGQSQTHFRDWALEGRRREHLSPGAGSVSGRGQLAFFCGTAFCFVVRVSTAGKRRHRYLCLAELLACGFNSLAASQDVSGAGLRQGSRCGNTAKQSATQAKRTFFPEKSCWRKGLL